LYTSPVLGVKESLRMDTTQTAALPEEITLEKPSSWLKYAAAGVFALLITAGLLFIPLDYTSFGNYGYLGVFLITLLASGGIIVPVPYLAVVVAAGTYLDPLQVGLLAGFASSIGELTGYALGYSGRGVAVKVAFYHTAEHWMQRYGFLTILVLSIVPNPFFDAAGLAAGSLRFPLSRFWIACFAGKTVRLIGIAYLGTALPGWFGH
jgi:membrane protein YqaA with SNARE-associated domain